MKKQAQVVKSTPIARPLRITPALRAKWKVFNRARRKDGYPKLNFELLVKTRNRIARIPESYDQSVFIKDNERSLCGTAACLAGEIMIADAPTVETGIARLFKEDQTWRHGGPATVARKRVGFHQDEGGIFGGDAGDWPSEFRKEFNKSRKNEPFAAVHFLDHVIKTGIVIEDRD